MEHCNYVNQTKQENGNQELIDKAIFSSKNLLTIINDILDFSKIEAGKLNLEISHFNLLTLVESIISDFHPDAVNKGIMLSSDIPDSVPVFWNGDLVRLRQILVNLCSNAVKFTDVGEVNIKVEADLETSGHMKVLQFTISDTGSGMSEHELSRLFERFEQADKSTTRKYGGTGLGMSITASLIDMMDGEILVESHPGKGSEFIIKIPLTLSEKNNSKADISTNIQWPDLSDKTILVAEDNQVNVMIIKKMLKNTNAMIYYASNGEEAIELSSKLKPDMILMDIQMPVLDGKDACIIIRKTGNNSPIIAFTANVISQQLEEYSTAGFNDYLAKPIEITKLCDILNTYLS